MERKYTKFPWFNLHTKVLDESGDQHSFIGNIVITHAPAVPPDEVEANAKLIAAAPDMLELLKESRQFVHGVCSEYPAYYELLDRIDAAIKKATE